MKSNFNPFNSGWVTIVDVNEDSRQSSFGAPVTPTESSELTKVVKLAYDRMSARQQDVEFSEAIDRKLDLKICVPFHPDANTEHHAVIKKTLYDIYQADPDSDNRVTYLYMQEVRSLA